MQHLKRSRTLPTGLGILMLGSLLTSSAQANFSPFPVFTNPNDPNLSSICDEEGTQGVIEAAYITYRDFDFEGTDNALEHAISCANSKQDFDVNRIQTYQASLVAAEDNNLPWPSFPFTTSTYTPPNPVAGNGGTPNSNQTFPAIIGAVGSLLESFIQSSVTQNPQPVPQAPPSAAPTVANDQSPANQTLAQWGLQQVPCNSPGLVFISGLSSDVLCINPTTQIPAGEYRYNAATHQLINTSSAPTVNGSN